jgi:hypothetical protein
VWGVLVAWGFLVSAVQAQLVVNPARRAPEMSGEFGAVFLMQGAEYEVEDRDLDIERDMVGLSGAFGLTDLMDVYGVLGYTISSELEDWDDDGDGILLAAGLRGQLMQSRPLRVQAYGQFQMLDEDYGDDGEVEAKGELMEFLLGVAGIYTMDPFDFYTALEMVPFSDGELSVEDVDADLERDSLLGLRFGMSVDFGGIWLRTDVVIGNEESLTAGVGLSW